MNYGKVTQPRTEPSYLGNLRSFTHFPLASLLEARGSLEMRSESHNWLLQIIIYCQEDEKVVIYCYRVATAAAALSTITKHRIASQNGAWTFNRANKKRTVRFSSVWLGVHLNILIGILLKHWLETLELSWVELKILSERNGGEVWALSRDKKKKRVSTESKDPLIDLEWTLISLPLSKLSNQWATWTVPSRKKKMARDAVLLHSYRTMLLTCIFEPDCFYVAWREYKRKRKFYAFITNTYAAVAIACIANWSQCLRTAATYPTVANSFI